MSINQSVWAVDNVLTPVSWLFDRECKCVTGVGPPSKVQARSFSRWRPRYSAAPQMNDVVCFRIQPAIFTAAKWHFEPRLWICIMSTWNNAPLIPRLCHMCASHIFTECAQSDKMHQRWYQLRELLPLSRITNVLCVLSYNFTFWFQRSPMEPLSWAWHRLMTRWCDIGHFANCMHSAKISLYSLSFTLFTPALEHSVLNGGSFAFQSSLLPPVSTTNTNADPLFTSTSSTTSDDLNSNAGIVSLLDYARVW